MLSQTPSRSSSMQTSSTSGASNQEQHLRAQLELLKNHDATGSLSSPSSRDQRNAPIQPAPPRPSNGYDELSAASRDASRILGTKSDTDSLIHPDLRARPNLAHAHAHSHAPTANMMPIAPPSGHSPGASGHSAAAIAPAPPGPSSMDGDPNDGRKAKRELSQSKRAAQNRAAQRAFRQRKEGYIKKLEQQVRDFMDMEQSYKAMQSENYVLREYVIQLQSRLLDTQGEFPQPPPNVNLSQPAAAPGPSTSAPEPAPSNPAVGTPLEAVAQAVAGLAAHEQQMAERQQYPNQSFKPDPFKPDPFKPDPFKSEPSTEDTRTADEINRQLQAEEGPASAV